MVGILVKLVQFNISSFLKGRFVCICKSTLFFYVLGSIPNCRGPPNLEFLKISSLGGKQ